MSDIMTKKIVLSQIVEDLNAGLTKWKRDDIGFGSLEKKYNLTTPEAIELFGHPKIKNLESRIPTFVIVDDLSETNPEVESPVQQPVMETKVEVAPVVTRVEQQPKKAQKTVIVNEEEPQLIPFI